MSIQSGQGVRSSMQRRPGDPGKIEKARDPRNALVRLIPYLNPFKLVLILVLCLCIDLYHIGLDWSVPDGRGDRQIYRHQRFGWVGENCDLDADCLYPD